MNLGDRSLRTRLAEELRAEMARQTMSYRQMAERLARPHNTVSYWLNGDSAIDPDILEAMCNILGMTTVQLYAAADRNGGWTVNPPPIRPRPRRRPVVVSTSAVSSGSNGQLMSTTRVLAAEYLLCDNYAAA